jgi:hypothetical protein
MFFTFLGDDSSLDSPILSDVENYFSSEENDTAHASVSTVDTEDASFSVSSPGDEGDHTSGDTDYTDQEQAAVSGVVIKQELVEDDEIQIVKEVTSGEKASQKLLAASEAKVGALENEVSKGIEAFNIHKAEGLDYLKMIDTASATLKEEHGKYKRIAHSLETKLYASDKRFDKLTESLKELCYHPNKDKKTGGEVVQNQGFLQALRG